MSASAAIGRSIGPAEINDVAAKLWGFCHTLRHDGVDYGDYIEQITYVLFIKMAAERGIRLPELAEWTRLLALDGSELLASYERALDALSARSDFLGDMFSGAQSRFSNPSNLRTLMVLVDETNWTALKVDVQAAAFEGLLERAAAEGKKGAGQYFTPRELVDAIVRCLKPDPRASATFSIGDPACGTGGFLVAANEWLRKDVRARLDEHTEQRIRTRTYYGQELIARPRRLAMMNLFLHGIDPHISLGDSIYDPAPQRRYDVVITNPPFGTRGANQIPDRQDFPVKTTNKQLNFLQHVVTILKPGGRAAVVVPDNVLFTDQAGEVLREVMTGCELHTVLRCPRGTFSPYTEGTRTNVLFFNKGRRSSTTWIYDARANVPSVTKKSRPLSANHFSAFEQCYGVDPAAGGARSASDSADGRWRAFSIEEIERANYNLDQFKWIDGTSTDPLSAAQVPETLLRDAIRELETALQQFTEMQQFVETAGTEL